MKANVVDLPALRVTLDRMDRILAAHPEARERTAAFLAGELPALEVDPMTQMVLVSLRLPAEVADRADALVDFMDKQTMAVAMGRGASRSTVLRLALLRGLEVLEAEAATHAPSAQPNPRPRKKVPPPKRRPGNGD